MSLHAMLAYAQRHAPEIRVAESRMARAEAEREAASPLLLAEPVVAIGAGPRRAAGGTALDYEVSVEQTFEIAGERGLRLDAAEHRRVLSFAEVTEVRWEVHLRVHDAFHHALVARARVDAAERLLAFAERVMEVANQRLRAGDIPQLQVRVAEGELALARQERLAAVGEYRAARLALAAVAGWPSEQPPEPAGSLDAPRSAPALEQLVEAAAARHPSLRTTAAAIAEADARTRLADREVWPNLTLGVALGREADPGSAGTEAHVGLVTLAIPLPLWNRNRGERARARADLSIARAEHQALRDSIRVRVARAVTMVNSASERIEVYGADIIPKFEESLALLGRGLELGEMDLLEVLVARGRFLELQREALDAYEDYYRAVAMLEAELGAEIWPDERHQDPVEREGGRGASAGQEELP